MNPEILEIPTFVTYCSKKYLFTLVVVMNFGSGNSGVDVLNSCWVFGGPIDVLNTFVFVRNTGVVADVLNTGGSSSYSNSLYFTKI